MAAKSSFLPRLSLSRPEAPILPFYNPSSPPLRKQPSEYDLSELSPQPEDGLLSSHRASPRPSHGRSPSNHRNSSISARYSDTASAAGSNPKPKASILFPGPPPPIATSALLYRDEEDPTTTTTTPPQHSRSAPQGSHRGPAASFARTALTSVSSVLFDRVSPNHSAADSRSTARAATATDRRTYEPDTIWRNLQRRERTLQAELQHLLDVQSAGLATHLGHATGNNTIGGPSRSSTRSDGASDAGSSTPTGAGGAADTSPLSSPSTRQQDYYLGRHVSLSSSSSSSSRRKRSGSTEQVLMPVRQPRRKPLNLNTARAALERTMAALADLKAEEDAVLATALGARKEALARLGRLAGRREGIMRALETHGEGPLGQELRELERERATVGREMAELEERLVGLRSRARWLDARIEDVGNRQEAGLSGYRNALREVEKGVAGVLGRPPVHPLDVRAIWAPQRVGEGALEVLSSGGVEFLRLRPERRTVEMARDWWEGEIRILEERKAEVDKDRDALGEGVEVWKEVVRLVSEFETGLRKEMAGGGGEGEGEGKGKSKPPTPEEAMRAQLGKMVGVMSGLEQHLRKAEDKSWNLLICAIGAELEAFREAELLLREALRAAGFGDGEEENESTPQLGRSMSGRMSSPVRHNGPNVSGNLVDLHDDVGTSESDNEVPPDLLVAHEEEHNDVSLLPQQSFVSCREQREDSDDEIPAEFLAQHERDSEVE